MRSYSDLSKVNLTDFSRAKLRAIEAVFNRRNILAGGALSALMIKASALQKEQTKTFFCKPGFTAAKGINITAIGFEIYSQWGLKSWKESVTPEILEMLLSAGFDHVRLAIDPTVVLRNQFANYADWWDTVAYCISAILSAGLKVIADLHVTLDQNQADFRADQIEAAFPEQDPWLEFKELVGRFAGSLKAYDISVVSAEIYNENMRHEGENWPQLIENLWTQFRLHNQNHTILVAGANFSSAKGLSELDPTKFDSNTGFVFHFYEPGILSHQGIGHYAHIHRLNYPLMEARCNCAHKNSNIEKELNHYFNEDYRNTAKSFSHVDEWCKKYKIPSSAIFMTEYGIHNDIGEIGANRLSRLRYIQEISRQADERHYARTVWSLDSSYWTLSKPSTIDPDFRAALFLKATSSLYPEAKKILDVTASTEWERCLLNATVKMLKDAQIWRRLISFYVLARRDEAAGLLNWLNPSSGTLNPDPLVFSPKKGFRNGLSTTTTVSFKSSQLRPDGSTHLGLLFASTLRDRFTSRIRCDKRIFDIRYQSHEGSQITKLNWTNFTNRDVGLTHLIVEDSVVGGTSFFLDGKPLNNRNTSCLPKNTGSDVRLDASFGCGRYWASAHEGLSLTEDDKLNLLSIIDFWLTGLQSH